MGDKENLSTEGRVSTCRPGGATADRSKGFQPRCFRRSHARMAQYGIPVEASASRAVLPSLLSLLAFVANHFGSRDAVGHRILHGRTVRRATGRDGARGNNHWRLERPRLDHLLRRDGVHRAKLRGAAARQGRDRQRPTLCMVRPGRSGCGRLARCLPGFGVAGAAWASVVGSTAGFAIVALPFVLESRNARPRTPLGLRASELVRLLRFGIPNGMG